MRWPWNSPEQAALRKAERDARFVRVAREAHGDPAIDPGHRS